jgi:hypothetical protein
MEVGCNVRWIKIRVGLKGRSDQIEKRLEKKNVDESLG